MRPLKTKGLSGGRNGRQMESVTVPVESLWSLSDKKGPDKAGRSGR